MSISPCPEPSVKGSQGSASDVGCEAVVWKRRAGGNVEAFNPADVNVNDLVVLEPMRRVRSGKRSRNIVVAVWSVTGQCVRELESGFEHDLHRRLDRPRLSRAVIPQPVRLESAGWAHTPDFLHVDVEGRVTLWDVRPIDKIDDKAHASFTRTAAEAEAVGWQYEVFTGVDPVERLNLMFANGYRLTTTSRGRVLRPWIAENTTKVLAAAEGTTTMEALYGLDDGTGSTIATIWHLISRGDLSVDLSKPIVPATAVVAS